MYKYLLLIFIILIIVLFVVFAGWFIFKKKQGICPFCIIKQFVLKSKLTIKVPENEFYQGGNASTPPMGWSSWNTFRNNIDEKLILETADALKKTGLADCGYIHVNLDDCWHSSMRDENGELQGDLVRFSSGIDSLAKEIRTRGLKIGLYSSNGDYTCEDLPATLGNEHKDAETFARWGVEYFKYDFCHNIRIPSVAPLIEAIEIKYGNNITVLTADNAKLEGFARVEKSEKLANKKYISFLGHGKGKAVFETESEEDCLCDMTLCIKKCGRYEKYLVVQVNDEYYEVFFPYTKSWTVSGRNQLKVNLKKGKNIIKLYNPVCTRADSSYIQYKRMGEALRKASDGKITYSICEWGRNKPEKWAWNAGNLWRISPDIIPNWRWINVLYRMNIKLNKYAGPGHWNDPDMLEVGNGKLTYEENKTHFSLWCMMAAPLILGNDIRKLPDDKHTLEIISNKEMIAVNQDKAGFQCVRFRKTLCFDYLFKQLENGEFAICIYNKSNAKKRVKFNVGDVPNIDTKNIKKYKEIWSGNAVSDGSELILQPHGCVVIKGFN